MARGLAAIEPRQQEGKNRHRTVFSLRSPSNVPWWRGTVCSEGMQGSGTSSRTRSGGWRDAQAAAEARQAAVRRRGGRMNGGDVMKPRVAAHAICLQRGARARPHAATQRRLALYCGSKPKQSKPKQTKASRTKAKAKCPEENRISAPVKTEMTPHQPVFRIQPRSSLGSGNRSYLGCPVENVSGDNRRLSHYAVD